MKVVFFGTRCQASTIVLDALLAAETNVRAIIIGAHGTPGDEAVVQISPPATVSILPLATPFAERTIAQIGWEHGLPIFELRRPNERQVAETVASFQPDIACVACFPHRIPESLLRIPTHGFLNYHPSLLPAHRGPEPLFWFFRSGETHTCVTIHFMDAEFDTGDIATQTPMTLPEGISGPAAEEYCARLGGNLMRDALRELADNTLSRQPQPAGGSYESFPAAEDFRIEPNWTAEHAFTFMRATADWNQPYPFYTGEETLLLREAIGYERGRQIDRPVLRIAGEILIQFTNGVLHAR